MARRGSYDNSRRAAQAQATAERILDASIDLLGTTDADLSVRSIALASGVAAPTVARYFPNREALFKAVERRVDERFGRPPLPESIAELRASLPRLHQFFAAHEPLVRAVVTAPALRPFWSHLRRQRDEAITRALGPITAGLPPEEARAMTAIVLGLIGIEQWLELKERWQLDAATITAAVQRGLDALLAEVARRGPHESSISEEVTDDHRHRPATQPASGPRDADRPGRNVRQASGRDHGSRRARRPRRRSTQRG